MSLAQDGNRKMKKNIFLVLISLSVIFLLNGCFEEESESVKQNKITKNNYEITDEFCEKLDGMNNLSQTEKSELYEQCLARGLDSFVPSPGWK